MLLLVEAYVNDVQRAASCSKQVTRVIAKRTKGRCVQLRKQLHDMTPKVMSRACQRWAKGQHTAHRFHRTSWRDVSLACRLDSLHRSRACRNDCQRQQACKFAHFCTIVQHTSQVGLNTQNVRPLAAPRPCMLYATSLRFRLLNCLAAPPADPHPRG